jgi:PAS domain S-box-containing protein
MLKDLAQQVVEVLDFQRTKRELAEARQQLAKQTRSLNESRELWRKTEQKATMALEAGGMGYWERDAATERIHFSAALEAMIGLDHDTFDGSMEAWLRHVHPDDRTMIVNTIEKAKQSQENYSMKYRPLTSDGTERWITTTGTYKKDKKGHFAGAHGVSWDSTAADTAAREMKRQGELFRGLIASAPVGVFRADGAGKITYTNSRFQATFGMTEQEVLGEGWYERVHPDDKDALWQSLTAAMKTAGSWEYEHRLLMPDGSIRWVDARLVFLRDPNGAIVERIGTVDDVTQRRQAIEDLQDAKESAEVANRTKDMFLANVSHELRTPMNGILGMNDLLLDSGLNGEQLEMAQMVKESAYGLLTVVNDILDLNRIEAGKLSIEEAPFDVRSIVWQTAALFEGEAAKKGVKLQTHFALDLPEIVVGDAARIKQILVNYLSNAIKFTAAGHIEIDVKSVETDGLAELLMTVSDSGPGIELEAQKKLFQPFSQIDASSTRRNGGIGLGLAISRRLAELMGGSVGVSSMPGEGSVFWVRLPLVRVQTATAHLK